MARSRRFAFSRKVLAVIGVGLAMFVAPSADAANLHHLQKRCDRAFRRLEARKPTAPTTPPPESLTSVLEVLRSTQPAQLPGHSLEGQRFLYSEIWPDSTRQLATEGGIVYYLLPAISDPPPLPRPCRMLLTPTEKRRLNRSEHEHKLRGPEPAAVLVNYIVKDKFGFSSPFTLRDIQAGKGFNFLPSLELFSPHRQATISGVVPDGVASVSETSHGKSQSASVKDNFFVFRVPETKAEHVPVTISWFDSSGTLLKAASKTFTILRIGLKGTPRLNPKV